MGQSSLKRLDLPGKWFYPDINSRIFCFNHSQKTYCDILRQQDSRMFPHKRINPTIGNEIGGRDHTTVIHAYDKIVKNLKIDDKLRQDVNVLKQKLYTNG